MARCSLACACGCLGKYWKEGVKVLSMKFLACVPGIAHLPIAVWEWEVFSGRHHPYPPEISDMKKG
eukprot:149201-Pelagomonas_calceolata.AAC.1